MAIMESKKSCPKCGKKLILRCGPYGHFYACEDRSCGYCEKSDAAKETEDDGK